LETLPFTAGDIGILIVLLASGLLALSRGFVSEVLSIAGWAAAALVTVWAYPHLQPFAAQYLQPEILANVATAAVVFVIALVVFSAIGHRIASGVRRSSIGSIDRILGLLFGLVRGALLVVLAYLALIWVFPVANRPAWLDNAKLRPWVEQGASWLASLFPEGTIEETLERAGIRDGQPAADAITELLQGSQGTRDGESATELPPLSPSLQATPPPGTSTTGGASPQIEVEIVPTPNGDAGN
jgi:membrane protein required for colicin V production